MRPVPPSRRPEPWAVTLTKVWIRAILVAVKQRFTNVRTQTCGLSSSMLTPTPGKPGLTSRAKGAVSSTVMLEARRAGCIERCSSGSREAAVSKPRNESIYSFYPMLWRNTGDRDRPGSGPAVVLEWVMPTGSANPSGGFGTKDASVRSTWAAVGSLHVATRAAGPMTRLGVRLKRPTVNSSTMKGA